MLADNLPDVSGLYYQIHQGDGTLLTASDITEADRERAELLNEHWYGSLDNHENAWVHAACYELLMVVNANEVARLKHEGADSVDAPVDELPPQPLPCPFCGADAAIDSPKDHGALVYCTGDECPCTPECGYHGNAGEAVKAWNTRATNATISQLRARVAALEGQR